MKTVKLLNFKWIYLIVVLDVAITWMVYQSVSKRTDYVEMFDKEVVVDYQVIKFDSISSRGVVLKNLRTGKETRRTDRVVLSIAEGRDTISLGTEMKDAITLEEMTKMWPDKKPPKVAWLWFFLYGIISSIVIGVVEATDKDDPPPLTLTRAGILLLIGFWLIIFV